MRCVLAVLMSGAVAAWGQTTLSINGATAPAVAWLFNEGLWRGMLAGVEVRTVIPHQSVLFRVPLEISATVDYFRPTASTVALADDYRGWIIRGALVWQAANPVGVYLRLGGGVSVGERYRREVAWDSASAYRWFPARSFVASWGMGIQGKITRHLGWNAEAEILTGDELGLLLPLRIGIHYRWGTE
ncbi:MAG: hypothetical protein RML15_04485 [Bacteroidota bacterium]|nr:hypothetical protein [Candidatus Kapabacteria bacterium]MDW8075014.1 hypothetical protein [Bacteroidota bacterium]MDW8271653.1 hypothetical protein [Bacteroidota bacterium]